MGNLILNLHSLDHNWAAWLARFRCCANYSTAIYYRFSFVLCCSNCHQTVVETGPFFSESVQECLCCCKNASKSQKGHVIITKIALFPVPSLCTDLAPLNMVSALAWSLWYEGSADSVHITVCISGGVFLILFSLDNRILTFLGSQETSWMHFRETLSLIRHSSIRSYLKACVGTLVCVSAFKGLLSVYMCFVPVERSGRFVDLYPNLSTEACRETWASE